MARDIDWRRPRVVSRAGRRGVVLALLFGLAGCAGLGPRSVVLSESELQQRLAEQFPREQRVLEFIDLTLRQPRLRLRPEQGRVASEVDVELRERLGGRSVAAAMAFDSALRFEPSDLSLRLSQVRVASLRLAPGGDTPVPLPRIASVVAERLLEDLIIWRASPEQAQRLRRAGVGQVQVQITPRGLELGAQ